jgi:hypothetical protein
LDKRAALEEFKNCVIRHDLPKTDLSLYGIRCPYCGKSDRVTQLELPDAIQNQMNLHDWKLYAAFWNQFVKPDTSIAVCKFCQNPLRLVNNGQAEPIFE